MEMSETYCLSQEINNISITDTGILVFTVIYDIIGTDGYIIWSGSSLVRSCKSVVLEEC